MLDLKLVQKQPEILERNLKVRHSKLSIEDFQKLDGKRRALIAEVETLKSERNKASQEVALLKRGGKDASARIAELGGLSDRIKALDAETEEARQAVTDWMMGVPNIPDASVPVGKDETENVEIRRWGTPPSFDFEPKPHWDLGTNLGGLGSLIASMASLISYRQIARELPEEKGRYFKLFTLSNLIFLVILLAEWRIIGR